MIRSFCCAAFIILASTPLFAQSESGKSSGQFTFYERFQGSDSTLGAINELDSSVGYNFNTHFSVDAGLPVYFVRPSTSTATGTGSYSANGIGNVYAQLRFALPNAIVNFTSTVTGTAPTGDKTDGFSTGHATVDWSNYFDRSFGHLTPFVNLGFANSVSDTMFFVRPYTTYGTVTHVEGGGRYRVVKPFSVGVSVYGILPSGQQTVVSRVVHGQGQSTSSTPGSSASNGTTGTSRAPGNVVTGNSGGSGHGVFESTSTTTGTANIAQDHGYSAWAQFALGKNINLYAGYTRSTQYSLNTLFYGIGFNLGQAFRSLGM